MSDIQSRAIDLVTADLLKRIREGDAAAEAEVREMIAAKLSPFRLPAPSKSVDPGFFPNPQDVPPIRYAKRPLHLDNDPIWRIPLPGDPNYITCSATN